MGSYERSEGLGLFASVTFGVGTMIGAGVFVLSGRIIDATGPAAILSYILCGIIVSFSALSYASLASIYPEDGGGYLFSRRLLGPYPGFFSGWAMYISSIIIVVFVLLGFGIYVNLLLHSAFDVRLMALMGLALLMLINLKSVSEAGKTEIILVSIKVCILLILVAFGLTAVCNASFSPFIPHGSSSIISSISNIFFAYMGFQVVSMMGGEIKSASRNVPIAIMLSLLIVAIVYVGVLVALLSADLPTYGDSSIYDAAVVLMGGVGGSVVAFAAVISTLSSANANILGGSRIVLEMAYEKQISGRFAKLYHQQPLFSLLLLAVVSVVLIIFGSMGLIIDLANLAMLLTMALVNISAIILHKKEELLNDRSYFRVPGGVLIPIFGVISCIVMLTTLSAMTFILGTGLLLSGTFVYILEDTEKGERVVLEIKALLNR